MLERADLFARDGIPLRVLISDVEFLLGALEALDDGDRSQLRQYWEVLEEVYSTAVAMREGMLDARAKSLVHEAVTGLRAKLRELVSDVG